MPLAFGDFVSAWFVALLRWCAVSSARLPIDDDACLLESKSQDRDGLDLPIGHRRRASQLPFDGFPNGSRVRSGAVRFSTGIPQRHAPPGPDCERNGGMGKLETSTQGHQRIENSGDFEF